MAEPLLSIQDIRSGYGDAVVLDGISLAVGEKRSLAILGRNGVGKSTLLLTLMGFTSLKRGRILFDQPFLPEGIAQLNIRNLRCGKRCVDLILERRNDSVLVHCENKPGDVEVLTIVS